MKRRVRKKARVFRINALTRKVTSIIAMVVVFTTTYMMILPAVAIDRQAAVNSPGMDVAAEPVRVLDCHSVPHAHTEACYAEREITDSEGNPIGQTEEILVCGREDYFVHVHEDACWQDGVLVCTLPEYEKHVHDENCYEVQRTLVCTEMEHVHSGACYEDVLAGYDRQLICGYNEGDVISPAVYSDPVYSEAVYNENGELVQGPVLLQDAQIIQEEIVHYHDDSCWADMPVTERKLICTWTEHMHNDSCYAEDRVLTCSRQELHSHTEACYEYGPNGETPEEMGWIHYEEQDGQAILTGDPAHLICGKNELLEHVHTDACFHVEEGMTSTEITETSLQENETAEAMPAQDFRAETETISVTVIAAEGTFPAGTTMQVEDIYDSGVLGSIRNASNADDSAIVKVKAVDITFYNADGEVIEPGKPVSVSMKPLVDVPDVREEGNGVEVIHVAADGNASVVGQTEQPAEETAADEVIFEAESFSVYALVYTVDFEYSESGNTYQFSLPGGGYVSLTDIAEILGLAGEVNGGEIREAAEGLGDSEVADYAEGEEYTEDAAYTEYAETAAYTEENASENLASEHAATDAAKEFVAHVESVTFSTPELVDVSRVEGETTVGEIKAARGLACVYSAELTEEQIAEINAGKVESGDWVLISVLPFTSEEELTITMKNGEVFTIRVTDAQISTQVMTANGERFRITVTYDAEAQIPDGSVLTAEEILEGSDTYETYLAETAEKWGEADREEYISFARFFDIEIRKDGTKIEPKAPVEVEIVHDDGLAFAEDESLSIIHFAENGTEIIDEIRRSEDSTKVVYEQSSFSVIGTVSTVKENGWPTANGQYVLVLQDGDDYYALKQDGTLRNVRYFNNTVSFTGEGTTSTDYIEDYLWYVVSSGTRGKVSDEYTEYNAAPAGQTFIDPYNANMLSGTSRQLQIRDGKIWCSGQLPGSSAYTQVTLSATGGQLSRTALTSASASPVFFATASSFTANDNETDLFTQVEVESIIQKWKEQKTQETVYDKTAEVYDYENRVYQIDITASSSDYEVAPSIALEFVVDASRSMFFPTSLTEVGTFSGTNASNVKDWINAHGDTSQVYFVIQNKNGAATQYAIFYDPNSEYTVNEPKWNGWRWVDNYVTRKGRWRWVDASNYNPPDDKANGGAKDSRYEGKFLDDWDAGSMDDGKIYTTGITGSSNGTYGERKTWISRIEYLKQCVRVASQVIYAVDEDAQIGLIGFNADTTDYGTFGKSEQQTLLDNINNISLAGGTDHQGGLQKAIDKYKNTAFYKEHYAGRKHVVVLVTDGAPNKSGVNWTTIGKVANTLKGLKDDFGKNTELYTMGLSLTNVGSNQANLFGISSGTGYTYAGEDAAQIINAVTKMVDGIFVQANLVADVRDVIDPAFYPVNKADGLPLAENDWISLNGAKVLAGAADAAGQIKKDPSTGNWYVEWNNQNIDWPTLDSHGAVTDPGWHGTVFVKAKEDFLGGNGISTNAEGSQVVAKKYAVRGESTAYDLPNGNHTTALATPFVNVDELDITKNDTEWTVYLGTNVDPLQEVKALWENVKVREVVTKTDADHRLSADGKLTYAYASNTNDNRAETNEREEISITDLGITLTDEDWKALLGGESRILSYSAFGHAEVGTVMISLAQDTADGEKDLSESPHAAAVTGEAVEKYTLTVSYRPAGANIANWHTGSYGSGMSGTRAGNILKEHTHSIHVFVKGLQITKVDLNDRILLGAKFVLYRTAGEEGTDLLEINGEQYEKAADLDTSSTGIAIKNEIEQLQEGEQYYLVETQVPEGYNAISPISVQLSITDEYTVKPGTDTQTTKPETGIYDWTQKASLTLQDMTGVKRTDADNKEDFTHSAVADSLTETVYYHITNNPGVELPATGGPGTWIFTILGSNLLLGASVMLLLENRRKLVRHK